MVGLNRPKLTVPGGANQGVENPALMEALIQAAEQLLLEHGPEGVSAIRIASRAGVSLGTLMQCFRSKDAIVAEALERQRRARAAASTSAGSRSPATAPSRSAPAVTPAATTARAPAPPRTAAPPPAASARMPAPPPASSLFRTPASSSNPPTSRPPQPEPPASTLAAPRVPPPPAAAPRAAAASPPAGAAPRAAAPTAPAESLEEGLLSVLRPLVSTIAAVLPSMSGMPQADRDAIFRVELKRLAAATEATLARHDVPDPPQVAYVMTLSCDKVIKDAIRHAPESFTDGRLEQALCRLCLDFLRSD